MVLGTCSGRHGAVSRSFFRMEVLLPLVSGVVMPLAADTCLTQGDTSFPGEPTSNDQLARVKALNSSLLCSPTQALGLPMGWVEAFAEVASPFKCFHSVLRPSLPGRCWTPTHSLRTNPHLRVCFLGNPTYVNHLNPFQLFAAQIILVNL